MLLSKIISNTQTPSVGRVEGSRPSMTVASKQEPSALAQSRPSESNLSKANNPQQTEGAVGGITTPTPNSPSEGRVEGNRPSMHNPQQATGAVGGTTTPTPFFLPCPQG